VIVGSPNVRKWNNRGFPVGKRRADSSSVIAPCSFYLLLDRVHRFANYRRGTFLGGSRPHALLAQHMPCAEEQTVLYLPLHTLALSWRQTPLPQHALDYFVQFWVQRKLGRHHIYPVADSRAAKNLDVGVDGSWNSKIGIPSSQLLSSALLVLMTALAAALPALSSSR
jgi:hypothetical protein